MKRFLAIVGCTVLLSGCVPHTELDRQGIAEAVGVDLENGEYTVTVQYFNTDSSGGVTAVDSSAPNVNVAEGKGATIESALQALSYTTGCEMMLGAVSFIVFGESALGELGGSLGLAASHYSGNLRANITAARGKASDIMNVKFSEGNASVEKLEAIFANAEKLGLTRPVTMYEALERLSSPGKSVVLPLLRTSSAESELTEDGSSVVIEGGAVFRDGSFAGELEPDEMSGLNILSAASGSSRECELTPVIRGKDTRVLVYGISSVTEPVFADNKLYLDISVSADCKIVSTSLDDPYAVKGDIEKLCEKELARRVGAALDKVLHRYGADATGLDYIIRAKYPDGTDMTGKEIPEYLKDCVINVSAKVRAERFGTLGA